LPAAVPGPVIVSAAMVRTTFSSGTGSRDNLTIRQYHMAVQVLYTKPWPL
jgi:hypothetical protein